VAKPRWMDHDGPTLAAWWEARAAKPSDWNAFTALPLVAGLDLWLQVEVWRALGFPAPPL